MPKNGKRKIKGFFKRIGTGIKTGVKRGIELERQYKADAPKRRAAQLAKLRSEKKVLMEKASIAREKQKIQKLKQKSFKGSFLGNIASDIGGADLGGFDLLGPTPRSRPKRKRKKRSSSKTITIKLG